jgi:hypothetical protein
MTPQLEALESLVSRLLAAVTASETTGTTVEVPDETLEKDDDYCNRNTGDRDAD